MPIKNINSEAVEIIAEYNFTRITDLTNKIYCGLKFWFALNKA